MIEEITLEELLEENGEEIVVMIQQEFQKYSSKISAYVADTLDEEIRKGRKVYKWEYDGCPYDYSGSISETRETYTIKTPLLKFLHGHTGASVPTFLSHYGMSYPTYYDWLVDEDSDFSIHRCYTHIAHQVLNQWLENSGIPADTIDDEQTEIIEEFFAEEVDIAIRDAIEGKVRELFPDFDEYADYDEEDDAGGQTIEEFIDLYGTDIAIQTLENEKQYDAELARYMQRLKEEANQIPLEQYFRINATSQKAKDELFAKYTKREVGLLVWSKRIGVSARWLYQFDSIIYDEIHAEEKRLEQKYCPISVNPEDYFSGTHSAQ